MSLYVDPKQSIIDATNTANATNLTLSDVTFGAVSVASDDVIAASGKNSSVRLTGNGTTWSGTVVVNYTRLDLNDLTVLIGDTLKVAPNVTSVGDLIKYFNYFYGMVLTSSDLETTDVITLDADGSGTITVRAKVDSYGWIGSYALKLVKGDDIVDYAITDSSLSGLNYPTNQSAKGQAPLLLYGIDFTSQKTALESIALNTAFTSSSAGTDGGVLISAINTAYGSTLVTMGTSAAVYNLYQSKAVYRGLNSSDFATNQSYKYVMMIQLADGTGNNGVPTTAYNSGFIGLVYLHYNDPIDTNATN